jgi:prepilin-type N-terminal cleavage/methylation domain-containing protein
MFTRAQTPLRADRLFVQASARAFTLIELLTVISIIAILSAISLNVVKGVKERASVGQAKAELAALSQALEMYKLQYGDYPQTGTVNNSAATKDASGVPIAASATDGPGILFNALTGKRGPLPGETPVDGKAYVDLARLTLQSPTTMPAAGANTVANAFVDPWGNRYLYYYKTVTSTQWTKTPSYILLSVGPGEVTGVSSVAPDGSITKTTSGDELDDIYANE